MSRRNSRRARRPVLEGADEKFADFEEIKEDGQGSQSEVNHESSDDIVMDGQQVDSDFELPKSVLSDISADIKQAVANITNNFTLTYAQVKTHPDLIKAPLNSIGIPQIQQLIRKERASLLRAASKQQQLEDGLPNRPLVGSKRSNIRAASSSLEPTQTKRLNQSTIQSIAQRDLSLAKQVINCFDSLDSQVQSRMLSIIDDELRKDHQLVRSILKFQVDSNILTARSLYDKRDIQGMIHLFNTVSAEAATLLHLEIALVYPQFIEASGTLSKTLIPYIGRITDFKFLHKDSHFIFNRFLQAMLLHHKDSNEPLGSGLITLALNLNPQLLRGLCTAQNMTSFRDALTNYGIPTPVSMIVSTAPEKFLYPDLLSALKCKTPDCSATLADIISKCDMLVAPGNTLHELDEVLGQRQLLAQCLGNVMKIKLPLNRLVAVLQRLAPLSSETIQACLQQDSSTWELVSIQSNNLEETKDSTLSNEQITEFYAKYTAHLLNPVKFDEIQALSRAVMDQVQEYRHNMLQSAIAGICISQRSNLTVVIAPTGCGKTWMQALIAKHFCNSGKRVLLVEPNEQLVTQSIIKLEALDYKLSFISAQRLLEDPITSEVVILDEYDAIIQEHPYRVGHNSIRGLWELRDKTVFAFSATSSASYERLLSTCINNPVVLRFQSEYEMVKGTSPVVDPAVQACVDSDELMRAFQHHLAQHYEQKPVIVILEQQQRDQVMSIIERGKYKVQCKSDTDALETIRDWEYGILLLLTHEARGIDIRFRRDAKVLIIGNVSTYHELQQMVGRSSRTRNVCEATLYTISNEKSARIIDKLKHKGVVQQQGLEKLMQVLEKKAKDQTLVKKFQELKQIGTRVASYEELKQHFSEAVLARLTKDIFI